MNEPDRWYARTPDTKIIPALQNMRIPNRWRFGELQDIASKSETRWVITDADEVLRGPLQFGNVEGVQRFLRYLVEHRLMFVREDGSKVLSHRTLPDVQGYPDHPDTDASIRNLQAQAARGSEVSKTYQGMVPPRHRQALGRAWDYYLERLGERGADVPDEKRDRRGYATTREEFTCEFLPWYDNELQRVGEGGRVSPKLFRRENERAADSTDSAARDKDAPLQTKVTHPEGNVTLPERVTLAIVTPKCLSQELSQPQTETAEGSEEPSFEIQKRETDKQKQDCQGVETENCHAAQNSPRDNFCEPGWEDFRLSTLSADLSAAVDLLVNGGVRPRQAAEDAVVAQRAEMEDAAVLAKCKLYVEAMPAFVREANKRGKPIDRPGGFLLLAIRESYDLPAVFKYKTERRAVRAATRALRPPGPTTSPDNLALARLDQRFADLPPEQQRAIDTDLLVALTEQNLPETAKARSRLRAWIEAGRLGEPSILIASQITSHRRAAMLTVTKPEVLLETRGTLCVDVKEGDSGATG